ncbi:MAG: hypothetical protein E6J26_11280 [Chloroflexi bacterium]|nr:MAG: hypothetical protein E6J26_11280 [Chloroflexota bacterium]
MTIPLIVLALLSLVGGLALGLPLGEHSIINQFLAPVFESGRAPSAEPDFNTTALLAGLSVLVGVAGILLAWIIYIKRWIPASFLSMVFKPLYVLFYRKWFVDEIYHVLIVLPAIGLAQFLFRIVDRVVIDGVLIGGAAGFMALWSRGLRWAQSGFVREYAFLTLIGAVLLVIFFLFRL